VVTAILYGVMLFGTLPTIAAGAGGMQIIDMHFGGYGVAEVQAFRSALSADALALYSGSQRLLDTAFPVLLAICLLLAIPEVFRRPAVRGLLVTMTLVGMLADLFENTLIAGLLAGPEEMSANLVSWASRLTIIKFTMSSAAVAIVVAQGVRVFLTKRHLA